MFITVHLAPVGARGTARDDQLAQIAVSVGVTLEPLHPGTTESDLAGQFFADVPDASADDICTRLRTNLAVVAAYPKSVDGPPSTGTL
ncbi:unnamed protein product [Gemmata massiliana]|uniref:Uncharacterized protein n=1 Tax=Gemmata massiliana TaxID=1210884 RepID=A0A6P2DFD9_9BACT|nr:hypothetical protein [Gemmata massiliana]VTR99472.1 unnamed protein product [Gemmata massiliana]